MVTNFKSKSMQYYLYGLIGVIVLLLLVLAFYQWMVALFCIPIIAVLFYAIFKMELDNKKEMELYISTLSYRLKKVGE